ncbi:MAG: sulfotransferase [Pseudomonadota bacterium]
MNDSKHIAFLLGAGRSGTTLLYKVLAAHPQIAYLSNYQNRWPNRPALALLHRFLNLFPEQKRRSWFMKEGGAYFNEHRQWLQAVIPTPSEAESVYRSCGLPLTPPPGYQPDQQLADCLHARFERIRSLSGGKVLLTKRTANNRRIPELTRMFPGAKYIHLVRDGRAVAYSLPRVSWWDDHVLYWTGQTPARMVAAGADPLDLAARNWVEEMHSLEAGLPLIPRENLLEVRYEALLADPIQEISRMAEFMALGSTLPDLYRTQVESLQLKPRTESWVGKWTEADKRKVLDIQGQTLARWGYLETPAQPQGAA